MLVTTTTLKCFHRRIGITDLLSRGIKLVEVSVAEAHMQVASFRSTVPFNEEEFLIVQELKIRKAPKCFDGDE